MNELPIFFLSSHAVHTIGKLFIISLRRRNNRFELIKNNKYLTEIEKKLEHLTLVKCLKCVNNLEKLENIKNASHLFHIRKVK